MRYGLGASLRLVPRLQVPPLLPLTRHRLFDALDHHWTKSQRRTLSTDKVTGISQPACRRQYISFYNYTPLDRDQLPKLCQEMTDYWGRLGALGRVYIAEEGINGQLVVPEPAVTVLEQSFPSLLRGAKLFYGHLLDKEVQDEETTDGNKPVEPFKKLDIRVRDQILRDGFDKGALNLEDAGRELSPEQWHRKLTTRNNEYDSDVLVLDVRNFYEHEIGRFEGATRVMVDTFRDTFDALDEILDTHEREHDGRKPKGVMAYCTGGIRCEKVAAYLTQYKGISNVQKLHGGIVNYTRFLKEQRHHARARSVTDGGGSKSDDGRINVDVSLFKGKNFVFDQRCVSDLTVSEQVTDDVLGRCFQCGEPCNHHINCSNSMCHGLILQCSKCARSMLRACSEACKQEFIKMMAMAPDKQRKYRKANALKWKPRNPNSVKFIRFRPAPPELLTKV
uniref:Rhodanese domain-containing protein n=1 Tax=Peronospora matthiolae TaxID=2874970 RepID=A0AAV1T4J5_9STRA